MAIWIGVMLKAGLIAVALAPPTFESDVLPIITRLGCNAAACHGSAAGRGGLKLSLYASDPAADYDEIVYRRRGRLVNFAHARESLLLRKPALEIEHEGGQRFELESAESDRIAGWIEAGAKRDRESLPVRLELVPPRQVISGSGLPQTVALRAFAVARDGRRRDVTSQIILVAHDRESVSIPAPGTLVVNSSGRHVVVARFLSQVATFELVVAANSASSALVDAAPTARRRIGSETNIVDRHVASRLAELGMTSSPPASDAMFLRRASLDFRGRLPTPTETAEYSANTDPHKRAALIDLLLAAPEFVDVWTYRLARILRIRAQPGAAPGTERYLHWLRGQVANDVPWDELVRTLLVAEGDAHETGPPNFWRTTSDARAQAEFVSEALLGVRLRCANCHNHPLDRWTQDDYHGLAAIFARVDNGQIVRRLPRGEVIHPRTGQAAVAKLPADRFLEGVENNGDLRAAFSDWLVSSDNPFFARAFVNRVWKGLFGRGLVEPVDDLSVTNLASHPELLVELSADFIEQRFQLRPLLRNLALSEAYARQGGSGSTADEQFLAQFRPAILDAELLADAISDVTGAFESAAAAGSRAIRLLDSRTPSVELEVLGRCSRDDACESQTGGGENLASRLHLVNGPLLNAKIHSPSGRLHQRFAEGASPAQIVSEFFQHALSRPPTTAERSAIDVELRHDPDPNHQRRVVEDLVWSLLTCREFVTKN